MLDSISDFERRFQELLDAATADNRVNRLTVPDLRTDIGDTHRDVAEDAREHGETPLAPYWNFVMADWTADEPAVFVFTAWQPEALIVYVGAGDKFQLLHAINPFTMAEVAECTAAVLGSARISGSVELVRSVAESWAAAVE
jgi:hypothetical protein